MRTRRKMLIAVLLVLPVVVVRGFTTIYPIIKTIYTSFFNITLFNLKEPVYCGLSNYVKIFTDPKLITSLTFTAVFTVCSMTGIIILGTGLARAMNMPFRGRPILRTAVLIPWAMPMVVVGLAAKWAFNDTYGLINDLIRRFIAPSFHFDWLIHTGSVRASVILVDLWKNVPYFAIMVLAALQFIDEDIYEAARIDGAGCVRSFFSITIPNIRRHVLTLSIFFTMWRLTSYDIVYAMTSGGPGDATTLLSYRIMTETFTNMNMGYASAIAVLLFTVMALLSGLDFMVIRRLDT